MPAFPGSMLPYLIPSTIPTRPARTADSTKHQTFTRLTGTPASAAPRRLPPVAIARTPKRVRRSMNWTMRARTATQMISDHSQTPNTWPNKPTCGATSVV